MIVVHSSVIGPEPHSALIVPTNAPHGVLRQAPFLEGIAVDIIKDPVLKYAQAAIGSYPKTAALVHLQ